MSLPLSSQKAIYTIASVGLVLFILISLFIPAEKATPILVLTLIGMGAIIIAKKISPGLIAFLSMIAVFTTYNDGSLVATFLIIATPLSLWCYSPKYWTGKDEKMFTSTALIATALLIYAIGWADRHHAGSLISLYLLTSAFLLGSIYTKYYWKGKAS